MCLVGWQKLLMASYIHSIHAAPKWKSLHTDITLWMTFILFILWTYRMSIRLGILYTVNASFRVFQWSNRSRKTYNHATCHEKAMSLRLTSWVHSKGDILFVALLFFVSRQSFLSTHSELGPSRMCSYILSAISAWYKLSEKNCWENNITDHKPVSSPCLKWKAGEFLKENNQAGTWRWLDCQDEPTGSKPGGTLIFCHALAQSPLSHPQRIIHCQVLNV